MEHLLQGLNGVDAPDETSEWSLTASWPCRHMSAGRRMDTYSRSVLSHECYRPKQRRHWFMHSSVRVLTTVTRCCSVFLTIYSGVFRQYKMLQHVLLLVPDVMSTSRPSWGNFIGCLCDSALNSSWQFWCTKRWMACLYNIWGMTDSTDDFDRPTSPHVRFQELAQVWLIHLLLLDRVRGTTNLSIYVTLHIKHTFLEFRRRLLKTLLFCWAQRRLVTAFAHLVSLHLHYITHYFAEYYFVLSQSTRLTDGQTERQKCLHNSRNVHLT